MHPDTAETAPLRNWLDIMTDLPWSTSSKDNLNLQKAEKILNEDHYGLERVKERIVESLAVRKLREKPKGSILCLVGPPGVGKTSLGRSVARALNRKFIRLSLGGLHDEAEPLRHARLAGDHGGDLVHAGAEALGDAGAELGPLLGALGRPLGEGGVRGRGRGVDVGGGALGDPADDLAVGRVEDVDRPGARRRHPSAIDVDLVVLLHWKLPL